MFCASVTQKDPNEGFSGASVVKNLPAKAGDAGSTPGLGRSPGGGNGKPLQDFCLENLTVHGVWSNLARMHVHTVRPFPEDSGSDFFRKDSNEKGKEIL